LQERLKLLHVRKMNKTMKHKLCHYVTNYVTNNELCTERCTELYAQERLKLLHAQDEQDSEAQAM
jgi:hypothetical protein